MKDYFKEIKEAKVILRKKSKDYKKNFQKIEQFIKAEVNEIKHLKQNKQQIIPEISFKNFTLIWFLFGILIPVATIESSFKLLSKYIKNKFPDTTKLQKVKTIIEYLIIFLIVKFVFF